MDIGVGLNATIPGVAGRDILDWARRADEGGLSSLGVIDRMTYPNHEPLVTLAAVAAVTERIRLTTTVLVAPQRNPGILAKQAATIDSISGGRLTLGIGIGGRESDYDAAEARIDFSERASVVEHQLDLMRRVWAGEPPSEGLDPMGPEPASPGGPEILYGGYSDAAANRAGRMADGFIAGNLPPEKARGFYDVAVEAWEEEGRDGRPRFVLCGYWGLGDDETLERGRDYLRDYYGFREGMAERAAGSMLASAGALRERFDAAEEAGVDEVILWPSVPDLDQLDRYLEVVAERA